MLCFCCAITFTIAVYSGLTESKENVQIISKSGVA